MNGFIYFFKCLVFWRWRRVPKEVLTNVGKGTILIADISGNKYRLPIQGRVKVLPNPGGRSPRFIIGVTRAFDEFVRENAKGFVKVTNSAYLERRQVKSIELIDVESYDVKRKEYEWEWQ